MRDWSWGHFWSVLSALALAALIVLGYQQVSRVAAVVRFVEPIMLQQQAQRQAPQTAPTPSPSPSAK